MHNNPFYLALLGTITLAVLWFAGIAGYRYYQFATLSEKSPATDISWSVKEYARDSFGVQANYHFVVAGQPVAGEYTFKEIYLNAWAAHQQIQKYSTKKWNVWYQPGHPHHSALQKKFPTKECASAMVVGGLLLYFLWLGFYVNRQRF